MPQTKSIKVVSRPSTVVKKITIGTPVKVVRRTSISSSNITDFDLTNKQNGSILIYDSDIENWIASVDLEKQNINGGNY